MAGIREHDGLGTVWPAAPTRVAIAGDWHGNTAFAEALISSLPEPVDVVLHLGDFAFRFADEFLDAVDVAARARGLVVLFIRGNHDDTRIKRLPLDDDGVHRLRRHVWYLPDGRRWRWWNRTWLALGGAVSMDQDWREPGVTWWPDEELDWDVAQEAMAAGPVDVVVAHDVPSGISVPGLDPSRWPPKVAYRALEHRRLLREVAEQVEPGWWFHGHMHVRYDLDSPERWGVMRVQGLGHDSSAWMAQNVVIVDPETLPAGTGAG